MLGISNFYYFNVTPGRETETLSTTLIITDTDTDTYWQVGGFCTYPNETIFRSPGFEPKTSEATCMYVDYLFITYTK